MRPEKGPPSSPPSTLAVNKGRDRANFYSVIVFGPTAQAAAEAIKRGDLVFVDGTLNLRPFTTRLNEQRVEVQIQADQWLKLHGRLPGAGPEEKPTPSPA